MSLAGETTRDKCDLRGNGGADKRVRAAQSPHRGLLLRHPQRRLRQRRGPRS